MIPLFAEVPPALDIAAKLAAVVGVIGLYFAYRQWRHAVAIAGRNERRAAVELAAQECTHYGAVLMPQLTKLREEMQKSGCQFFEHFKLVRKEQDLLPDASDVTEEDYQQLNQHAAETLRVLNEIEGFAIPFAAGVADNRVGFVECGRSLVTVFENNFGLYARHDLKNYYPSTQTLYWRWRREIEKDDTYRMHLQAGREFFTLTERIIRDRTDSQFLHALVAALTRMVEKLAGRK